MSVCGQLVIVCMWQKCVLTDLSCTANHVCDGQLILTAIPSVITELYLYCMTQKSTLQSKMSTIAFKLIVTVFVTIYLHCRDTVSWASINKSFSQSINQSISQSINQPTNHHHHLPPHHDVIQPQLLLYPSLCAFSAASCVSLVYFICSFRALFVEVSRRDLKWCPRKFILLSYAVIPFCVVQFGFWRGYWPVKCCCSHPRTQGSCRK